MPIRSLPSPSVPRANRLAPARGSSAARLALAATSASLALLTGCGVGRVVPAGSSSGAAATRVTGHAFGGQQPISGSTIQLYAAGTSGLGSASTPLLTAPVQTDASGSYDITGLYTCPSASTQVYITATGGNPGLSGSVDNHAIALVTALGDCGNLASTQSTQISELTTVAAAWALAPFSTGIGHIGSTPTNLLGLRGAMRNARLLVDPYNGGMPSSLLPANGTVESAKLTTLADILATCVNSSGGPACTSLFVDATLQSLTPPADVFEAALSIARHPGNNVAAIFNHLTPQLAFPGPLTAAPSDWTLTIAYTGGGMNVPAGVVADAGGNLWVSGQYGMLTAFSGAGVPQFTSGITGSGLNLSGSVTIDPANNVWVANQATSGISGPGSVARFNSGGTPMSGAAGYTGSYIDSPSAVAADTTGNVWVANAGSDTVTLLNSAGVPLSGALGYNGGVIASPSALAVDLFHNVWVANYGSGTIVKLDPNGNTLRVATCCVNPSSMAVDNASNLWVGDRNNNRLSLLGANGLTLQPSLLGGGLNGPASIVLDTLDHVFVVNQDGNSLSEFAGSNAAEITGTPLSPSVGFGAGANLHQPLGATIDGTGSLWVTSSGDNRLVNFVGMAAPVKTPRYSVPQVP